MGDRTTSADVNAMHSKTEHEGGRQMSRDKRTPEQPGTDDKVEQDRQESARRQSVCHRGPWVQVAVATLVLLGAAGAMTWFLYGQDSPRLNIPAFPGIRITLKLGPDARESEKIRQEFFDESVVPLLEEAHRANVAAGDRCLDAVWVAFDAYLEGVPAFSEDVMGLGSRLGILWRMGGDFVRRRKGDERRVAEYMSAMFGEHVFSPERLEKDLEGALVQFREDVEAIRNRLVVDVRAAVETADLPLPEVPDLDGCARSVEAQLVNLATDRGRASVYTGIAALVVGEAVEFVVHRLLVAVAARVGASAVAGAAAGGSATAGTTATGAGAGSFGGPAGTIVGIGIGLGVGVVIDWWMSEKFEARLNGEMKDYVEQVRTEIYHGKDGKGGLTEGLRTYVADLRRSQAAAMESVITEVDR